MSGRKVRMGKAWPCSGSYIDELLRANCFPITSIINFEEFICRADLKAKNTAVFKRLGSIKFCLKIVKFVYPLREEMLLLLPRLFMLNINDLYFHTGSNRNYIDIYGKTT